jgi:hypothetical protein
LDDDGGSPGGRAAPQERERPMGWRRRRPMEQFDAVRRGAAGGRPSPPSPLGFSQIVFARTSEGQAHVGREQRRACRRPDGKRGNE